MRPAARILPWALLLLGLAAATAGAAQLAWHAHLFASRVGFPLDLEWMEGGMLVHARRIADGQPIYVKPSLDFIPFLYTPLYPAVLAGLSKLVPLGYVLGRALSICAFLGALAAVVFLAGREGRGQGRLARAATALVGVAGAGAVAAGFEFTGAFYDLARSDSLLLVLEAAALALAFAGRGIPSAAGAGVVIALAFFTKQTASLVGVGLGLGLLVASWRRGLAYGAAAAVTLALGLLILARSSGGWFWTYIFELHQSHPFRWDTLPHTPGEIARHEPAVLLALCLATVGLALGGRLRRADVVLWAGALSGIASGVVGFATMWAWQNAYIPALYFPVLAAAVLAARLFVRARHTARPGAVALATVAVLALGYQNVHAGKPRRQLRAPAAVDRAAAGRFLDTLRGLPGDGFIPFHPYYGVLVGKRPFVHRMGVMDVAPALGRPEGLDKAMLEQRFSFVVLDWKSQPHEWPFLETRYRIYRELRDGFDTVRHFSGADTWPRRILLPMRASAPLPPGGRRIADFESGHWEGWTAEGEAFGAGPHHGTAEIAGRLAADSGRFGAAATGTLRSPVMRLAEPRLRFTIVGPQDAALRVLLLDGPQTARAASPGGGAASVEWDVSDLEGRDVVLVAEDRSSTGALALDDVVVY